MQKPSQRVSVLWKADKDASDCHRCKNRFGLLLRKHHCRVCGDIFCHECSSRQITIHTPPTSRGGQPTITRVRACEGCYGRKDLERRTSNPDPSTEVLVYNTASLCGKCSLVEKRGFDYRPAEVFEWTGEVWMRVNCPHHGKRCTLISRSSAFFRRMLEFQLREEALRGSAMSDKALTDIEDMMNRVRVRPLPRTRKNSTRKSVNINNSSNNDNNNNSVGGNNNNIAQVGVGGKDSTHTLPLLLELDLFQDDQFIPQSQIDQQLTFYSSLYPEGHSWILKINGGLVEKSDIPRLNDEIKRIESLAVVADCPIVVDLSPERLFDLCRLEKTCLLKGRVYPAVRYFLEKDAEDDQYKCIRELEGLIEQLRTIADIQLTLLLNVEWPYPNISALMDWLFKQKGFIRFTLINRHRSPSELYHRLANEEEGSVESSRRGESLGEDSVDPYELLQLLQQATNNRITPNDFVPVRLACLLEPFLAKLGYGRSHVHRSLTSKNGSVIYIRTCGISVAWNICGVCVCVRVCVCVCVSRWSIRPSAFCGFAVCLLNTPTLQSVPVSRVFDLSKMHSLLLPKLEKLEGKQNFALLWAAKSIQKAIRESLIPENKDKLNVDLLGLALKDDQAMAQIEEFAKNLQFIVVHNQMDFNSVDLRRRCECIMATTSPLSDDALAATCTGCV